MNDDCVCGHSQCVHGHYGCSLCVCGHYVPDDEDRVKPRPPGANDLKWVALALLWLAALLSVLVLYAVAYGAPAPVYKRPPHKATLFHPLRGNWLMEWSGMGEQPITFDRDGTYHWGSYFGFWMFDEISSVLSFQDWHASNPERKYHYRVMIDEDGYGRVEGEDWRGTAMKFYRPSD